MSKYTTEVRFICEDLASRKHKEFEAERKTPDEILAATWDSIFTTKTPFFDDAYREVLCKKILKHFYLREIGAETVGIWLLWMNTKLEEIMPYYNQLYQSELLKFNPLYDVDVTTTSNRDLASKTTEQTKTTVHGTGNDSGTVTDIGHRNDSNTDARTSRDNYSDTPQGVLDSAEGGVDVGQNPGVEKLTYLTNARKITDNSNGTFNSSTDDTRSTTSSFVSNTDNNGNRSGTHDTTEGYLEHVVGKRGTETFSGLLMKFRETFLNIDMMVIEEFNELFMGLW